MTLTLHHTVPFKRMVTWVPTAYCASTVPLRLGASVDDAEVDKKWRVVVNQEIEIDDL